MHRRTGPPYSEAMVAMPSRGADANGSPAVDDLLCFALYAASRSMTAQYRPLLEPLGLTYPQFLVLLTLYEHGRLTVAQIGATLRLDSGTLSPLLRRLADNELVTRTRSTDDERSVVVGLTPRARRLRPRLAGVHRQMCDALSGTDLPELIGELRALTARLDGARSAAS